MFAIGSETMHLGWSDREVLLIEAMLVFRLDSISGNLLWWRVLCCISVALLGEMEFRKHLMLGRMAGQGRAYKYGTVSIDSYGKRQCGLRDWHCSRVRYSGGHLTKPKGTQKLICEQTWSGAA